MSLYHLLYVQSISSRDPSISLPHLTLDPEGILASFCKTGNMDRYCILQDGMGGFSGGKEQGRGGFRCLGIGFFFFLFFFRSQAWTDADGACQEISWRLGLAGWSREVR